MLKFNILDIAEIKKISSDEYVKEVLTSFSDALEEGVEVAYSITAEHLFVRLFADGEYSFVYPIALTDNSLDTEALTELSEYAKKEEIPLLLCSIPPECIDVAAEVFKHTREYFDGECYAVSVISECSLLDEEPRITDGVINLAPLGEGDISAYADICLDNELNKYWGYDASADPAAESREYFYLSAKRGFELGVALTLGVYLDGELIGDGTLWGFDLVGGCEIAFRIKRGYQGRGFGRRTMELLIKLADSMEIDTLYARVDEKNSPLAALLSERFTEYSRDEGKIYYKRNR